MGRSKSVARGQLSLLQDPSGWRALPRSLAVPRVIMLAVPRTPPTPTKLSQRARRGSRRAFGWRWKIRDWGEGGLIRSFVRTTEFSRLMNQV